MTTSKSASPPRSKPLAQLKEAVRVADKRAKEAKNAVKAVRKRAKQAKRELKRARKALKQAQSSKSQSSKSTASTKPVASARAKSPKKASATTAKSANKKAPKTAAKPAKNIAVAGKELRIRVANSPESRRKLRTKARKSEPKAASDELKRDTSANADSAATAAKDDDRADPT